MENGDAMGHADHPLAPVPVDEGVDGGAYPGIDVVDVLASGRHRVGIAGSELGPDLWVLGLGVGKAHAVKHADTAFAKASLGRHRKPRGGSDGLCGLYRADQIARDQRLGWELSGQTRRHAVCLLSAALGQCGGAVASKMLVTVAFRLAVADQNQGRRGFLGHGSMV